METNLVYLSVEGYEAMYFSLFKKNDLIYCDIVIICY